MRRADRMFQIVQHLRGRRLTTAAVLAERLGVSPRTLYRDIRDLSLSGVPIRGEAGVGYSLAKSFDLPPIMFTFDEVEALVAGARAIESWGGPALAAAARSALEKVSGALPPDRREQVEQTHLYAPGFHVQARVYAHIDPVRAAVVQRRKMRMRYRDVGGNDSERTVLPLGLYFWGVQWTLAAWCEVRNDFRTFRLDRIVDLHLLEERFEAEEGRSLEDFLAQVRRRGSGCEGGS